MMQHLRMKACSLMASHRSYAYHVLDLMKMHVCHRQVCSSLQVEHVHLSLKARWYRDRSDSSLHSGLVLGDEVVTHEGSHYLTVAV